MITVITRNSTDRHCNCNTFNEFYHATTDKRIQMYVSAKTPKAMPSARTWLRAITTNLVEFDIIVRHNVAKKNLYEQTKRVQKQTMHRTAQLRIYIKYHYIHDLHQHLYK